MVRQVRRLVRASGSAVLLAAPPAVLWRLGGSPLPSSPPSREQFASWVRQPLAPGFVHGVFLLAGWLVWAALAAAAAVEVYGWAARHQRRLPRLAIPRPLRALTATMLGAATVTASAGCSAAAPAHAATAAGDTAGPDQPTATTAPGRAGPVQAAPAPAGGPVYRVVRGDRMWSVADRFLHDPRRYTEIAALNPRYAAAYDNFPDHIEPGDELRLPRRARDVGARAHARGTLTTTPPRRPARPNAPPGTHAAPHPAAHPTAPGDDGVAGTPAPAAPVAPTPTGPAPAGTASHPSAPARRGQDRPGVTLTGDSWVDLGLAAAVAAAATAVWKLRRRRYTPRPSAARPRLDDPDLAPMPAVVTRMRRGLRAPVPDEDADDAGLDDLLDDTDDVTAGTADDADTDADPPGDAGHEQRADRTAVLSVPALGNPMLAAWPPAGLGLTGPGADAAARGFLASALAAGGVDDPHGRACVVLPAATAATLLGAAAVNTPDTPRLTVTGDLAEALQLLEEQTLHRTRLVYGHEVDDVAQLRQADPSEEPLPPILLLADGTGPHERARIAALLAQGQRLDIHGILLGDWPDGTTVAVAADGTTTPADDGRARHGAHPADVGRLAVLTAAEAAALLPTLAESHTGLPQPPAPIQPPSRTPATAEPTSAATGRQPGQPLQADPVAAETADSTVVEPPTRHPVAGGVTGPRASSNADTLDTPTGPGQPCGDGQDADDGEGTDEDGPGVVAVRVLGRPAIVGADPGEPLRAKALELLVYLVARDGDATVDAIIEDLVPDATLSKAPHRIHTYVYALRKALRRTGGPGTYLTHPRHRYVLNRDAVDVDLWRMRDALAEAETATGQARVAALRRAVAEYGGPFADRARYEWAEPYREAVRRQALDAHLALADALADQPEQALAVLDAAIAHDPYAEPLYQAAMHRHADLDDIDAVAARLAELTRRLDDLDAEPADETTELAATLTDDVRRRARRTPGATA
jgi:DNA-binding SARP family transcriptional activator